MKNAKVIRGGKKTKVDLGATVVINMGGRKLEYALVGPTEANPLEGKISNESPVGKALIGASVGDVVNVETQAGIVQYKVLEIQRAN